MGGALSQAVEARDVIASSEVLIGIPKGSPWTPDTSFEVGGIVPGSSRLHSIALVLESCVVPASHVVLIEDDLATPGGSWVRGSSRQWMQIGAHIVWSDTAAELRPEWLSDLARDCSSGYPLNGFIRPALESEERSAEAVASAIYGGFVSAYDAETLMFWCSLTRSV